MNSDLMKLLVPNRPDVLGFSVDSNSPRSKYIESLERLAASLRARATPLDPADVRGKRKGRVSPESASNTMRVYLRSLEVFSLWMQGRFGYELDPKDVTRKIVFQFLEWLFTTQDPNLHIMRARAAGGEVSLIFAAAEQAVAASPSGEVGIQAIFEYMPPSIAVQFDPARGGSFRPLHRKLGAIVRQYKSLLRIPTVAQLRAERGSFYSIAERDPFIYRYSIRPRRPYRAASAATYVGSLSVIWEAMTEGENNDLESDAPLRYNPWKGPRGPGAIVRLKVAEDKRRREKRVISNAIVDALLEATIGTDFEARRNKAAIVLLIYTGIRAEELVGALRKDLVNADGVLALKVYGKGDKLRTVPIYSEIREAMAQLEAKLEEMSQTRSDDPDARWLAAYATTLLQSLDAPIIPALPRWGANARAIDPTKAALEPLDTSGLRAILNKLQDRARVFDRKLQIIRPLNETEAKFVHPHALRHYAATAAQEAGLAMEKIQEMLGHEDVRTTKTYVHVAPRAMTQVGAYIASARAGAVMSPEEAASLEGAKSSVLKDPNIAAAPAQLPGKRPIPTKPKPRTQPEAPKPQQPEPEPIDLDAPIASPDFAYQDGAEKLEPYLPLGYLPNKLPKGQGARLTLRIGALSRLPWWAGRANRWKFEQMAPIASFYQMFALDSSPEALRPPIEKLWKRVLNEKGVTAASAFAEWVAEVLGYASAMWFDAMRTRIDDTGLPDEWIAFDEEARPSDGVVRTHPLEKILGWFEANAVAAKAPVVRTPPSWMRWDGSVQIETVEPLPEPPAGVEDVFRTVIRVERLPGFDDYFKPKTKQDEDVDVFKPGTGKDSKRVRYRAPYGEWGHGIVTTRRIDPLDPAKSFVTIEGDLIPDNVSRLEAAWDKGKRESAKRARDAFYPMLVDIVKLPPWFFSKDPIGELPADERKKLQDWIEKLQGRKLSRVRVTSVASELWNLMLGWKDAQQQAQQKGLGFDDEARRREIVFEYEDQIRKVSKDAFTVEVDPRVVMGKRGAAWAREQKKKHPEAFTIVAPPKTPDLDEAKVRELEQLFDIELDARTARKLEDAEASIEQLAVWAKKLPPGEKRIFAYVQMQLGFNIPITQWGLSAALIESTEADLFAGANLTWENGTIVHSRAVKERFFRAYGTDSECVVRRMLRNLWERKKAHDFEYVLDHAKPAPAMSRDILHRHINAWMAYLIPCPAEMEAQLRVMLETEGAPVQFQNLKEVFDEDMLGQVKDQPMELAKWWVAYKGEQETETALGLRIGVLEQVSEKFEGGIPQTAKPNMSKAHRVVPSLISLVFAEYWPV